MHNGLQSKSEMVFNLTGRKAIVTGAGAGIGRALAIALAESGAQTVAVDIQDSVEEIPYAGLETWHGIVADVSAPADVQKVMTFCEQKTGGADILMNVAAITTPCPVGEMTLGRWREILDVNLTSVFLFTRAVLPLMAEFQRGSIVNFSSMVASTGGKTSAHYSATKGGIEGFSRSLAAEVGPQIRVNVVAPGMIDTSMLELMPESQRDKLVQRIPVKRLGIPADFVGLCLLLASDAGSYINGQTIHVNGGLYMT